MLANMYFAPDFIYALLQIVVTLAVIAVWALSFVRATVNLELSLQRRIYWGVIQAVFPPAIPFYLWKYEKSRAMRWFSVCGMVGYLVFWFAPYDRLMLDSWPKAEIVEADLQNWGWDKAQGFVSLWGKAGDDVYETIRGSFTALGWSGIIGAMKESHLIEEAQNKNMSMRLEATAPASIHAEDAVLGQSVWVATYPSRIVFSAEGAEAKPPIDGTLTLEMRKTGHHVGISQWIFVPAGDNTLPPELLGR